MQFQEFRDKATQQMRNVFIGIVQSLERLLKAYFILTVIVSVFDFAEFVVQLVRFGRLGDVIGSNNAYRNTPIWCC